MTTPSHKSILMIFQLTLKVSRIHRLHSAAFYNVHTVLIHQEMSSKSSISCNWNFRIPVPLNGWGRSATASSSVAWTSHILRKGFPNPIGPRHHAETRRKGSEGKPYWENGKVDAIILWIHISIRVKRCLDVSGWLCWQALTDCIERVSVTLWIAAFTQHVTCIHIAKSVSLNTKLAICKYLKHRIVKNGIFGMPWSSERSEMVLPLRQ